MKIRKKDWIEGEIEEGKETGWYRRKNRGRIKSLAGIKGEIKEE